MKRILALVSVIVPLLSSLSARAVEVYFVDLTEKQEVGPTGSSATGFGTLTLNADNTLTYNIPYQGLQGNWTASHIHGVTGPGTNAGVIFTLNNTPNGTFAGTLTGTTIALNDSQLANLRAGLLYVNIHSVSFPGGEIRGQVGPLSTFTYQGRLGNNGSPANGTFDLTFALFDSPGGATQIGNTITNVAVTVSNGVFAVTLDFFTRPIFDSARWLEISVRTNGGGAFMTLSPRQKLTAAPYATTAGTLAGALPATQINGSLPASQLSGVLPSAQLSGIYTGALTLNNAGNSFRGSFSGDGAGLTNIQTSGLADGAITAAKLAAGVVPKFISLDTLALHTHGAATTGTGFGPNSGMFLPDGASTSTFEAAFTIPPNYTPGTALVIHVIWHTSSTNCNMSFPANYISVARAGSPHLVGGGATTGLTIVGGSLLAAAATPNQSTETLVQVTSPVGGNNLAPGDSIHFGLFRNSPLASDTCTGDMVIQGLWVTYQ